MFQCADRIAILPITRFLEAGAAEDRYLGGGRGHIFICSCYAQLISFEIEIKILKSIVFTVCEQEYMNMCPPPLRIIDLPPSSAWRGVTHPLPLRSRDGPAFLMNVYTADKPKNYMTTVGMEPDTFMTC